MTLHRFWVEVYEPEVDDWDELGSVLLPFFASSSQLEHALAAVGVFAPRGADHAEWHACYFACVIYDALDAPMVRLRTNQ